MSSKAERHSIYYYMHGVLWPVVITLIIEVGWRLSGGHIILGFLGESHIIAFPWIIRAFLFIVIGLRFGYQFKGTGMTSAIGGVYAGAVLGIIIGLFDVIWYHNLSAWLSLFALPWQTVLAGFIVAGATGHMAKLFRQERIKYLNTK